MDPFKLPDGEVASEAAGMSKLSGKIFYTVLVNDYNYGEVGHQRCDGNLREIVFDHLDVERMLWKLNVFSACRPDGIHPPILKP